MSKEKPEYRLPAKSKFRLAKMDNPSEFLQRHFGVAEKDIKPFDRIKGAENMLRRAKALEREMEKRAEELVEKYDFNADDAQFQAEMEASLHKEAKKPEYWGLTWDDLRPVYGKKKGTNDVNRDHIRYYITEDNIRFPPVQWQSKKSGKIFEALPQYIPEGGDREKTRYNKLYFRDNDETMDGHHLNAYTLPTDNDLDDFRQTYINIERDRLTKKGVDLPYMPSYKSEAENNQIFMDWLKEQEQANAVETADGNKLVPIKRVNAYSEGREDDYEGAIASKPRAYRGSKTDYDEAVPQEERDARKNAEEAGEVYVGKKKEVKAVKEKKAEQRKKQIEEQEAEEKEKELKEVMEKAKGEYEKELKKLDAKVKIVEKKEEQEADEEVEPEFQDLRNSHFKGRESQDIKDELFRLIGEPRRQGNKNTPTQYGKTMNEIAKSILRLRRELHKKNLENDKEQLKSNLIQQQRKLGVKDDGELNKILYLATYEWEKAREIFDKDFNPDGDDAEMEMYDFLKKLDVITDKYYAEYLDLLEAKKKAE